MVPALISAGAILLTGAARSPAGSAVVGES